MGLAPGTHPVAVAAGCSSCYTRTLMTYHCTNISIQKGKQSSVTISGHIPTEALATYRTRAIVELGKNIKIDGFRPGHIPENVLIEKVGEPAILQETAEHAITEQYPLLIAEEKLLLIGRPNVNIKKLSLTDGMDFEVVGTLLPELTLPDYKKLAASELAKQKEITVTDEEVQDTLTHLRRERAKIEKIEAGMEPALATTEVAAVEASLLPAIDDEFVKTLGYESAVQFTEKLYENIKNEKTRHEHEKTRIAIIESIIAKTKIDMPDVLIDAELANMEAQFSHDLAHQDLTLEKYLEQVKKTKEDLHKEWRDGARKRATMQLLTREIAKQENITPDPAQVQSEVDHVVAHTKGADRTSVESYVTNALRTEMVFRFLEEQR